MLKAFRNENGETIIEVLITLTILAVILGLSYASAGRSLKASQTAQERTEAQYIAVSMIEAMKIWAQRNNTDVFPTTVSNLCFKTTLDDIRDQTDPITYNPASPQFAEFCTQGRYTKYVTITPLPTLPPLGLQQYEYQANIEWESLEGGVNQSVMRYKFVIVPDTP